MKVGYILAALIAVIGAWLLAFGVSDGEYISLLGMELHSRVARGVGIVSLLISVIAFMAAYGSSLPPSRVERRH